MKFYLTFISFLLFVIFNSYSATIKVPSEYATIQAGMDAASEGDTVLIADGTYSGEGNLFLSFAGKAIVVKSENGPENCIINCADSTEAEVFQILNGETRESVVEGLKIINGGWVINIQNSSPTIKNNIFENDTCGIYCGLNSDPLIENNVISKSIRYGLVCYKSSPTIQENNISNNLGLGILCSTESNPLIDNNTITQNIQSGISCYKMTGTIQNNTITENEMNGIYCTENSNPEISNNLVSQNGYPGIYCLNSSPDIVENEIIENLSTGIYCNENSNSLIENNIISKNEYSGIACLNSAGIIQNNTISENKSDGIRCDNSSPDILGNQIYENLSSGILCEENSNSFIENNTISKNEYNGINIIDSEGIIQNNTITENENKGINCYNSSPDILKNDINKNIFTGIYCKISSPIISKNLIIKNGGNSIFSNDGVALKSFNEYNEVEVAQHGGISIKDTSNANIQNNIISQNWGINSGGIFCDSTSSASIINNHLIENASIDGGSMNVESSSVKIINNIIANSKKIVSNQRLSRWYKDNLFSEYIYEGINLKKVIYYFGFINNGPPGTVLVTGCVGLHKTVWAETGERFWVEAASGVTTWGEGGGLSVTVSLDTSSFQIINRRPDSSNPFITHGCDVIFSPTITSYGVGMSGVGIVVPNQENMPEIAYNNVYGNPGGNYIFSDSVETKSAQIFDLTGTDGNISSNPLLDSLTYELLEGSPCIDAGTPDTTGLSIGLTDYFGNPRFVVGFTDGLSVIDIGAVEYQFASTTTNEYILICQGEEYEGWFESGEYQRTLSSTTGTDSIVTTHLTVNPTYELEEDVSICEGEDYLGITEEGDHSREFETVNGCDSTVITHLKVNSVFNIVEDISICKGDNYEEFTTEGQHQREFISENGCDSIVITNLTVYPSFKPTFSVEVDTLISDIEYQTYQWYDAGGAIEGATNREFAITESGDFYLMASNENGCTYSSETFFVRYSISEEIKRNKFVYSILPNPNWGEFNFRIDSNPPEKLTVKLINGLGQVFEVREIEYPVINQIEHFNVSHLSKGIYHFVIQSDNYREDQKIVILK